MLRKPRVVPETSAIPSEERGGSPLSNLNDVLNGLSSASLWQERVYKDLHAHPELSFHETRTAALAAAKLKELGYEVLEQIGDRKSTRLNSSHGYISYAVFCLKKKKNVSARV